MHADFRDRAKLIDEDIYRTHLGLPRSMEDLANAIKEAGLPLLESDDSALAWNGLTVDENKRLFRSRDPVIISLSILRGLLNVNGRITSGKLAVELVHGSVTDAAGLDAIAVGTFDGIPLGGAGGALDLLIGGLATAARAEGRSLIPLNSSAKVDAGWIYLASLGRTGAAGVMEERIRSAALETAATARRHGLRRLGIVAYGGNVIGDLNMLVTSMLDGLKGFNTHAL